MAIRVGNWKISFKEQDSKGLDVWKHDFTNLRAPNIYNVRSDPFERGTESFGYGDWMAHRMFLIVPAQAIAAKWLESFKEFPPRQKPASFSLDEVMEKTSTAGSGR
jgi:arylsulfatase